MTTVGAITADLRRLGVAAGDTVMVHASLRRLGRVEGGAAGVIEAIDHAVGPTGTWLMVLGTVAAGPGVVFDHLTSPSDPDVGVLAEVFRTTAGTHVNDHPEARFGARGRSALELLADPPWHDYFGPGSVLERLCHRGGKVLRLGSDLDTMTILHYAEYLAPVPGKRRVRRHSVVAGPQGPRAVVVDCLDDSDGIVDWEELSGSDEDYFATITRSYLAAGRALGTGRVGRADSELVDAADLVAYAVEWMTAQFTRPR